VGPYQLFFAPAGQERCTLKRYMVGNKNATNDIEAAMNNHREFVFMFGDLRDVCAFHRRPRIYAAPGYKSEGPKRDRAYL
jgi:hypothetical protein